MQTVIGQAMPTIPQMAQPFLSIALPIVASIFMAAWLQNKRFEDTNASNRQMHDDTNAVIREMRDDINRRFDDVNASIRQMREDVNRRFDEVVKRLERIETKQDSHEQRLTRVEERTSPFAR